LFKADERVVDDDPPKRVASREEDAQTTFSNTVVKVKVVRGKALEKKAHILFLAVEKRRDEKNEEEEVQNRYPSSILPTRRSRACVCCVRACKSAFYL
jgi:ribosomal protein S3